VLTHRRTNIRKVPWRGRKKRKTRNSLSKRALFWDQKRGKKKAGHETEDARTQEERGKTRQKTCGRGKGNRTLPFIQSSTRAVQGEAGRWGTFPLLGKKISLRVAERIKYFADSTLEGGTIK